MVLVILGLTVALTGWGCGDDGAKHPRVVVIGFDGMDPRLCGKLMNEGRLPNLKKMRDAGGFKPLGTSIPPQSPVAWSNFITGAGPGVHGIFDFVHRDPKKQCEPYYSAARTIESDDGWEVGDYRIPLTFWPFDDHPTHTVLKRHGTPFWDYLDERGIPVKIYDIPSNYPPSPSKHGHVCCLAGMGVPDLLGGYGTYQYFSQDTPRKKEEGGGIRKPLRFFSNYARAKLTGPKNTLRKKPVDTTIDFEINRHPQQPQARIDIQGHTILLNQGEWSDWVQLNFTLDTPSFLPNTHVSGICRFFLMEVRPNFRLYVTPINIDPSDPGQQRVTEPPEMIVELADQLGLFYTAGFQEDHKALSNGVFSDEDFYHQARYVLKERKNLLDYAKNNYKDGFLFFYFSSTDLQAHMFWWNGDNPHPTRSPEQARHYNRVIEDLYTEMDGVVGDLVARYGDDATVLVMSDHGFGNFDRQFNLNTWLRDEGYLGPETARDIMLPKNRGGADWSRTRAYGLGLNGLYVNLKGRERDGIVDPADRSALLEEIREKLLTVSDPKTGQRIVKHVYRTDEVYSGPFASQAPDLIVGYYRGYRASWATTMGRITDEMLSDNDSAWSADHCIAADEVPGVVFANRRIQKSAPSLVDLAPTILTLFGVPVPDTMTGSSLFKSTVTTKTVPTQAE